MMKPKRKANQIKVEELNAYGIDSLHIFEIWLIRRWRELYRYGEITVVVKEGLPQRIRKVVYQDDPRDNPEIKRALEKPAKQL